jgi:esterase/lipase
MKELVIYVHGKGGEAEEAEHYKPLFPKSDVIGFDYKSQNPWEAKIEFSDFYDLNTKGYDSVILIANSIGAFFSMNALVEKTISKALFILRYEYKREAKRRKVEEQNRLYDLLRSVTQTQIDRIAELTKEYRRISSTDPDSAKTLLAEIAVLCSYIKRRKHLTLLTDRDIKIAATELLRAFNESLQTLKLLGVRNSLYVDESLSMLSSKTATAVFDFYESVIEADILNLTGIQVSLIKANGLHLSLNVCCKADLSALVSGDGIRYEKEDDEEYQRLVFEAKEGDRK